MIIDQVLDQFDQHNIYSDERVYRDRRVISTLSAWLFLLPFQGMFFFSIAWLVFVMTALFFALFFSPPTNTYIAALPTLFVVLAGLYSVWENRHFLKFSRPKFDVNLVSDSNYIDAFDDFGDPPETIDPKLREIMESVSKEDGKKIAEALEAATKKDYSLMNELSIENTEKFLDILNNSIDSK